MRETWVNRSVVGRRGDDQQAQSVTSRSLVCPTNNTFYPSIIDNYRLSSHHAATAANCSVSWVHSRLVLGLNAETVCLDLDSVSSCSWSSCNGKLSALALTLSALVLGRASMVNCVPWPWLCQLLFLVALQW